jgi:predicted transcriptional regulator YdeE
MKKALLQRPEIKIVGLSLRTNNQKEMDPITNTIGQLVHTYLSAQIAGQIPNRKNPGVTLSVFTEYDSNEHGDYTYIIGEEVEHFGNVPTLFKQLTIPASKYQRFTTKPGQMPQVVVQAWQQIWQMSAADLGGQRAYQADFEVYDERALDPARTTLDIYIGIK